MEYLKFINSYINYVYYVLLAIIFIMLIVILVRTLAVFKSIAIKKDSFNNMIIYLKHIEEDTQKIQYTIDHSLPDLMKALLILAFLNDVRKDYFKTKKPNRNIRKSFTKEAGIYVSKNVLKRH